jgi:chromosome segregation ATPase
VDSLAIQRSLTLLEDRYRELREIGEKHAQAWEAERANLLQQLSARADDLAAAQASHQAELNTTKQDNDRLLNELNTIHHDNNRLKAELNTTKQDNDRVLNELNTIHHDNNRLEAELNTTKHDNNRLQSELNDSRHEGELLVIQLHQVQDELEYYYLESKELEVRLNEKVEGLHRLRGQRKSLIKLAGRQAEIISRLLSLQSRVATPAAIAFDRLGGLKWLKALNSKSQQPKSGQKRLKASRSKQTVAV